MQVGIAEKVFKVRGQRSGSLRDQMHFCDGGLDFDDVAPRLTCLKVVWCVYVGLTERLSILVILHCFVTNKPMFRCALLCTNLTTI